MTKYAEGCHIFYDPVVEYMDSFFSWCNELIFHKKYQVLCHNLLPLHYLGVILIQHDEEVYLLDKLLGWIHWKSYFT